jgi:hypothetical protein
MSEVTRILSAIEHGDPHAAEQLLPLVYDELRKLAAQKLAQERPGQTLQATALVHEVYVRLVGGEDAAACGQPHWDNRRHFFAAAAERPGRLQGTGGAAQAEHAAVGFEGFAAVDLGAAAHGTREADDAGPRRAGLDRDEGAGKGP